MATSSESLKTCGTTDGEMMRGAPHLESVPIDSMECAASPMASTSQVSKTSELADVMIRLNLTQMESFPIDPIVQPNQQPWIDKRFPPPRTGPHNRILPKLSITPSVGNPPPYGHILIQQYYQWRALQGRKWM